MEISPRPEHTAKANTAQRRKCGIQQISYLLGHNYTYITFGKQNHELELSCSRKYQE